MKMPRLMRFENMEINDSSIYYKDVFENVRLDMVDYRDEKYRPRNIASGEGKPLFNISDDDFTRYNGLVNTNRRTVIGAVRMIISALMRKENIITYEPRRYPIGDKYGKNFFNIVFKNIENQKVGIKFYWSEREIEPLNDIFHEIDENVIRNEVDKIYFVLLEFEYRDENIENENYCYFNDKQRSSKIDELNKIVEKEQKDFAKFISFEKFFTDNFGYDEYKLFLEAVDEFNNQVRNMLGYKTFFMPNQSEVNQIRLKRIVELIHFDFKKNISEAISNLKSRFDKKDYSRLFAEQDKFYDICYDKFINKFYHRALAGNKDFADSFISSEWYYSTSFSTDVLDKTAIVVGYLKSVEQLLYKLLCTHIGDETYEFQRRHKLKKKEKERFPDIKKTFWVPFDKKYEEIFDKTFGSMITFIKIYKDCNVFEDSIEEHWKLFIIEFLFKYCKEERNDHLHKDNIYKTEKVDKIRDATFLLYFMLLGSFKLSKNDYNVLGIDEANKRMGDPFFEEFFINFVEWVRPLIDNCQSLDSTICFDPLYSTTEETDILRFAEVKNFNVDDFDNELRKLSYKENELLFDINKVEGYEMTEKEKAIILSEVIRLYLNERNKGKEDKHKYILIIYGMGYEIL